MTAQTKNPRLWIGLFSALGVLLVAAVDMGRSSPGELSTVHQRDEDLVGRTGCSECHGGFTSSMTSSCLDCHEDVEEHIETGHGLHGLLPGSQVKRCAACHSEHHGAGFTLVNLLSFTRAGVEDPALFEHDRIGFAMAGKHLELECTECHEHSTATVLPPDARRYMGLEQDCATCHEDSHEGRYVLACARCHGQEAFEQLESFGHEKHLPLIGGHAEVTCAECHTEATPHSLDALGVGGRPGDRTCLECHASPHTEAFVRTSSSIADMAPGAACVVCHEHEHATFRDAVLAELVTPEQHAGSGFSLAVPHDEAACADCHSVDAEAFVERYPGRGADQCSACHEDPHGGQFAVGPFSGGDCITCHERTAFDPHAFTVEQHELASLPLFGSHVETECSACHLIPDGHGASDQVPPRTFRGSPGRCEDCHQDAHEGYFAPFDELLATLPHGACEACHISTSFAELPEGGFDHQRWTGFPIDGAHAQEDCAVCHPLADFEDELGRAFGRVFDHFGPMPNNGSGCAVCHGDPHVGYFDVPELPSRVEGRTDCARCHVTTSFRAFPETFEHRRWTGFALDGQHGRIGCSECHAPLFPPDEFGRTWQAALGTSCASCHADPHGGQFQVDGVQQDCAKCHRAGDAFAELRFDHDRDSRFALGDAHAGIECTQCHPLFQVGETELVRYRPLPSECVDCHGVHEDVLLRRKVRKR